MMNDASSHSLAVMCGSERLPVVACPCSPWADLLQVVIGEYLGLAIAIPYIYTYTPYMTVYVVTSLLEAL